MILKEGDNDDDDEEVVHMNDQVDGGCKIPSIICSHKLS